MLSPEEVRRIARLARIELADHEIEHLRGELDAILALVDQMQVVDTNGIEPMAHPQDARQRLREDVVTDRDQRALYQSVAPATEDGLYLVPKVIE